MSHAPRTHAANPLRNCCRGLEKHGGKLMLNSHVERVISADNRTATGVALRGGGTIIATKAVISSACVNVGGWVGARVWVWVCLWVWTHERRRASSFQCHRNITCARLHPAPLPPRRRKRMGHREAAAPQRGARAVAPRARCNAPLPLLHAPAPGL